MSKSVIDGNRKFVLYWPWDNATHLTIMKSHAAAKGVRTSARNWHIDMYERGGRTFNHNRYIGWIYELQTIDGDGVELVLIDGDLDFIKKYSDVH